MTKCIYCDRPLKVTTLWGQSLDSHMDLLTCVDNLRADLAELRASMFTVPQKTPQPPTEAPEEQTV